VFTHAPAFFVKSQPIISGRRARLMGAYKTMIQPDVISRIQENREILAVNCKKPFMFRKGKVKEAGNSNLPRLENDSSHKPDFYQFFELPPPNSLSN
jgi:hypothetical protein